MIETGDMEFESRAVAPEYTESDAETEFTLRPQTLQEYIGQDKVKEKSCYLYRSGKTKGRTSRSCTAVRSSGIG